MQIFGQPTIRLLIKSEKYLTKDITLCTVSFTLEEINLSNSTLVYFAQPI